MIATQAALALITERLAAAGIEEPRREARILLAAAEGASAAGLLALDEVDEAKFAPLLRRREARERHESRLVHLVQRQQSGSTHALGGSQQNAGLAPRLLDPRRRKLPGDQRQGGGRGNQLSAASRAAWSSAISASMISSISPSITRSILCKVRLMRWSVTRPCGKL